MWKLETEATGRRSNPTESDIESALADFARDGGFVILSRAREDYVQCGMGVLEYRRDGRHFRVETGVPEPDLIRRVFRSFFRDDDAWRTLVPWRDVSDQPLRPARRHSPASVLLGLTAACVIGAVFWWFTRH